ncbi:MAG: hypothetical protein DSY42_07620 [Aquifex sp.]|nr:MAG: hypothetical protein DSY42_07620 [Aquifex sp.]
MQVFKVIRDFLYESRYMIVYAFLNYIFIAFLHPIIAFLLSLVALLLIIHFYLQNKSEISLKSIFGSVLSASFPTYTALFSTILFVVYTAWFADYLKSYFEKQNNVEYLIKAAISFLYSIGIFPVFVLSLKTEKPKRSKDIEPKKVLISALSYPYGWVKDEEEVKKLKEALKKGEEALKELERNNWVPILRSMLRHKDSLEHWYILVSNKSGEYKELFYEIVESFDKEIAEKIKFIPQYGEISFDNYDDIYEELRKILKEIRRNGFSDEDISVFISGGTSAVTLALTIFAIKEGRQVEYMSQESKELLKIDIGLEDLYSFAPELRRN